MQKFLEGLAREHQRYQEKNEKKLEQLEPKIIRKEEPNEEINIKNIPEPNFYEVQDEEK